MTSLKHNVKSEFRTLGKEVLDISMLVLEKVSEAGMWITSITLTLFVVLTVFYFSGNTYVRRVDAPSVSTVIGMFLLTIVVCVIVHRFSRAYNRTQAAHTQLISEMVEEETRDAAIKQYIRSRRKG